MSLDRDRFGGRKLSYINIKARNKEDINDLFDMIEEKDNSGYYNKKKTIYYANILKAFVHNKNEILIISHIYTQDELEAIFK